VVFETVSSCVGAVVVVEDILANGWRWEELLIVGDGKKLE
jgi:hypothetical protein